MNFLPLLEAKRDGKPIPPEQIRALVSAYAERKIPDYQMAAFLMAVYFRGLSVDEVRAMTLAMRDSGTVLKFPHDPRPLVDKHSTGGVGDKVSLPLAPLLACLGFRVPMISGRGLGITGGTLDKLESIPNFITALTIESMVEKTQKVGIAMCGQNAFIVPADQELYALRDVTGTSKSIPLITSSILSKKLAESLQALILDVKFGSAALITNREQARQLARLLVTLANECGVNTRAVLTDMDTPLGRTAGNWLEIRESVDCLECRGPEDLEQLVLECAAQLLVQTGKAKDLVIARQQAAICLASGEPRKKWDEMIVSQGADYDAFYKKLAKGITAPYVLEWETQDEGFITECDAGLIGEIVRDLGGGRLTKESAIHHEVGIDQLAKPGEPFGVGSILARIHAVDEASARRALERLKKAVLYADEPPEPKPLIVEMFT